MGHECQGKRAGYKSRTTCANECGAHQNTQTIFFTPNPYELICTIKNFKSLSQRPQYHMYVNIRPSLGQQDLHKIYQRIHNITRETYSEINCPLFVTTIQDLISPFGLQYRILDCVSARGRLLVCDMAQVTTQLTGHFRHRVGTTTPLLNCNNWHSILNKDDQLFNQHLNISKRFGNKLLPYYR